MRYSIKRGSEVELNDNNIFVVIMNDKTVAECRRSGIIFLRKSWPENMVFQLIHELGH